MLEGMMLLLGFFLVGIFLFYIYQEHGPHVQDEVRKERARDPEDGI